MVEVKVSTTNANGEVVFTGSATARVVPLIPPRPETYLTLSSRGW